jgi:flagellar hook-associated protein 3 FlgL
MKTVSLYSGYSTSLNARRNGELFVGMRQQLDDLQRQLSTGEKSESYGGLGFERRGSLDIRGKIALMDGYKNTIDDASLRVKLMTQNISRLSESAAQVKGEVLPLTFELGSDGRTTAQNSADARLREAIDLLNADLNGRRLFSGRSIDIEPVESYDRIMNGDPAAGKAGLTQLISERKLAEMGSDGLGRIYLNAAGTLVQVTENATPLPFGFNVMSGVSSGSGNVTVTNTAGSAIFNVAAQPVDGDKIQITLRDKALNTHVIEITARTSPIAGDKTAFQIGATPTATATNIGNLLTSLVKDKATEFLAPRAAMLAATEFFNASPSTPPQRVIPPAANSAGMQAGTSANSLIWYKGDDTAPSARQTAAVRVDSAQTIGTGAQANEAPIRTILAQFGVLANETFTTSAADKARYLRLTDAVRNNLSPTGTTPNITDIGVELGNAASAMNTAKERHKATEAMLRTSLDTIELATPEETAAAVLTLNTRLQASYQTTSLISKLSLVNFL